MCQIPNRSGQILYIIVKETPSPQETVIVKETPSPQETVIVKETPSPQETVIASMINN